jgi:CBS-domain-containing membrane protein
MGRLPRGNAERVVLGLLRARELDRDPALRIEQAMRPGPSTFRPYVAIEKLVKVMTDHGQANLPITTSDGRLVGLVKTRRRRAGWRAEPMNGGVLGS